MSKMILTIKRKKKSKNDLGKGVAIGAAAGALLGAAAGMLFAPKSGKEIRKDMADNVSNAAKAIANEVKGAADQIKQNVNEILKLEKKDEQVPETEVCMEEQKEETTTIE